MTEPATAPLRGRLERADPQAIAGWAFDPTRPAEPVALLLRLDGKPAGTILADRFRADLRDSGVGDGHHAFHITLASGLASTRQVSLSRESDGAELELSPATLPQAELDAAQALDIVAAAVAAAASDPPALNALLERLATRIAALEPAPDPPQAAFLRRWGQHAADAPNPAPRGLALVIDEAIPDPAADAGSQAMLSHIAGLQALGYGVDFVPAWSPAADPAAVARLAATGVQVWHAPWIASVEEVLAAIGPRLTLVYLHRHGVMARYAALVRRWAPQARLVYSLADLHHLRLARAEAVAADTPTPSPAAEALRLAELNAVQAADATITHSSHEAALLRAALPDAPIHRVPWAIPPRPVAGAFAARHGLAFIGSYGHQPNLDAAFHLLDTIMPLVWAEAPGLTLRLAGSAMPDELRRRAAASAGPVEILGHLDDLDPLWASIRLSIAPLRFGAGVKGKVLASLAAGIACICTPIAAEGLDLPPALQSLVAADAPALARLVLDLHDDQPHCAALREAGLAYIAAGFNPHIVAAGLARAAGLDMDPPTA